MKRQLSPTNPISMETNPSDQCKALLSGHPKYSNSSSLIVMMAVTCFSLASAIAFALLFFTARVSTSGPTNPTTGFSCHHSKLKHPVVILVSLDGFRFRYQYKTHAPNIDRLIYNGTIAETGPLELPKRYCQQYNESVPFEERVDTVLGYFDMKDRHPIPSLMTLYFEDPDHQGHQVGPDDPQITEVDDEYGYSDQEDDAVEEGETNEYMLKVLVEEAKLSGGVGVVGSVIARAILTVTRKADESVNTIDAN
ncbi:hypothetical protein KI387_013981 [Taxus chinensis]|uniref:Uncharacterized protein n=1 Tax=Taxus chinensis TaxID=29808 RepID=A0AA38CPT7_TAXCH|nr:hypothetical protein KI387_013981 [Taxus chinensis]